MSVTFLLALISQCRFPLVSEEELTGICVFRSCHTLFNFQGSLPVRQSSQPVAGGVSRGQLCYNTTSRLICQHLFLLFFRFSFKILSTVCILCLVALANTIYRYPLFLTACHTLAIYGYCKGGGTLCRPPFHPVIPIFPTHDAHMPAAGDSWQAPHNHRCSDTSVCHTPKRW